MQARNVEQIRLKNKQKRQVFMNKEMIQEWISKYKKRLVVAILIIAVLVIAFFAGDEPQKKADIHSYGEFTGEESTDIELTTLLTESNTSEETGKEHEDAIQTTDSSEVETTSEHIESIAEDTMQTQPVTTLEETVREIAEDTKQPLENEKLTCTFSISCIAILNNMDKLDKDKKGLVPEDGWILKPITVEFKQGETVVDILKKVCMDKKIHMESSFTPVYNSAYIEGINNLYEFDCGSMSGWMYGVNGEYYNYGCSQSVINNGDKIEWVYTCDLGKDVQN